MYPTLYHLLKDLFGIEFCLAKAIQMFGLLVALAFVAGAYILSLEMKRKESMGLLKAKIVKLKKETHSANNKGSNIWLASIIWFVIGFKLGGLILNSCEYAEDIRAYLFSSKGNIIIGLISALYGFYSTKKENEKQKSAVLPDEITIRPYQLVGNITFIAAIFGMLGAKIFHLLENPDEIPDMFTSIDSFFSGLTIYGGLLLGSFAALFYAKKQGLSIIHVVDSAAPALLLAYGIGRLGCQLSGDGDWGIDNLAPMPSYLQFLPEWLWAYDYPHNVLKQGIPIESCQGAYCYKLENPVFPTPLYESIISIFAFAVLWSIRNKITTPGIMICIYLMINGFERFWVEKIRVNETYNIAGKEITQAEIISTVLFIVGIIGIFYIKSKVKKSS